MDIAAPFSCGTVVLLHSTSKAELNNQFVECRSFNATSLRQEVVFLKPCFKGRRIAIKLQNLKRPEHSNERTKASRALAMGAADLLRQFRQGKMSAFNSDKMHIPKAIELAKQALASDPCCGLAYQALGDAYQMSNDLQASLSHYLRAVANNAGISARLAYSSMLGETGDTEGELNQLRLVLHEGLTSDGLLNKGMTAHTLVYTLSNLGSAYSRMKPFNPEAVRYFVLLFTNPECCNALRSTEEIVAFISNAFSTGSKLREKSMGGVGRFVEPGGTHRIAEGVLQRKQLFELAKMYSAIGTMIGTMEEQDEIEVGPRVLAMRLESLSWFADCLCKLGEYNDAAMLVDTLLKPLKAAKVVDPVRISYAYDIKGRCLEAQGDRVQLQEGGPADSVDVTSVDISSSAEDVFALGEQVTLVAIEHAAFQGCRGIIAGPLNSNGRWPVRMVTGARAGDTVGITPESLRRELSIVGGGRCGSAAKMLYTKAMTAYKSSFIPNGGFTHDGFMRCQVKMSPATFLHTTMSVNTHWDVAQQQSQGRGEKKQKQEVAEEVEVLIADLEGVTLMKESGLPPDCRRVFAHAIQALKKAEAEAAEATKAMDVEEEESSPPMEVEDAMEVEEENTAVVEEALVEEEAMAVAGEEQEQTRKQEQRMMPRCKRCKQEGKFRCARCTVAYCSQECQRSDWKRGHNQSCRKSMPDRGSESSGQQEGEEENTSAVVEAVVETLGEVAGGAVVVDAVEETVAGAEQEQKGKQGQQEQKGKQGQQQQQQLGEQDEELEEQIGTPDPTGADLGDCPICYDSIAEFMPDGCAHRCCKSCLTRNERSDQDRMRKCPFCEHSYSSVTNVATLEKSNLLPLPRVHEAPQGTDVQESARVLEEFDEHTICTGCGNGAGGAEDEDATEFMLLCEAVMHHQLHGSNVWEPTIMSGVYHPCPNGTHIQCCEPRPWPIKQVRCLRDVELAGNWFCEPCTQQNRLEGYPLKHTDELPQL
jgi:tetratricopeptide (TPR) repeat protein